MTKGHFCATIYDIKLIFNTKNMGEGDALKGELAAFLAAKGKTYPERPAEVRLNSRPRLKRGPALEPEVIRARPPHQRKGGEPLSM